METATVIVSDLPYALTAQYMAHEFAGGCPDCGYGTGPVMDALGTCTFCAGTGETPYDTFEAVEKGGKHYKTEGGQAFPSSDYAYVPDASKPSSWKLRLTSTPGGKPDARVVGMAVAALGKGFRGNKVQIPASALAAVKRKVRAAWREANKGKNDDAMPEVLKAAAFDAEHEYATVQLVLDHHHAKEVCEHAARLIAADDVHPDKGMETRPHITVRYGLDTDNAEPLIGLLKGSGPVTATVHGVEIFEPPDADYDVVVLRVTGERLEALWRDIGAMAPAVPGWPEYKGHITLGYVKRGAGAKYAGADMDMEGKRLTFETVEFNARDDVTTTIPLIGGETLGLEALAMLMPELDRPHPNRVPFEGTLTRIDEPSTRPPNGSRGHRVMIPRSVAQKALDTLIGMGVGVDGSLKTHRRDAKVGIITEAWIAGNDLNVKGHLFAADFPREVEAIQERSRGGSLGMSYEIMGVEVEDSAAPVWTVRSLTFTGAAILYRHSAAYEDTRLAASREDELTREIEEMTVTLEEKKTKLQDALSQVDALLANDDANVDAMSDEMVYKAMKRMAAGGNMGMLKKWSNMSMAECMKAMRQYATQQEASDDNADENDTSESQAQAAIDGLKADMAKQIGDIKAAMALLTDAIKTGGGLTTDGTTKPGGGGMLTDAEVPGHQENGGPARRTATVNAEQAEEVKFIGKDTNGANLNYPQELSNLGFQAGREYTESEVREILDKAGQQFDMSADANARRNRMEIKALLMRERQY